MFTTAGFACLASSLKLAGTMATDFPQDAPTGMEIEITITKQATDRQNRLKFLFKFIVKLLSRICRNFK
jgi:hypothetical protein